MVHSLTGFPGAVNLIRIPHRLLAKPLLLPKHRIPTLLLLPNQCGFPCCSGEGVNKTEALLLFLPLKP